MIEDVINNHLPATWSHAYYTNLSVEINLSNDDLEYQSVSQPFGDVGLDIESIKRIQNPYLWGRFKLRMEHMKKKDGGLVYEHVMYHPINPQDGKVIAEYNCDYRRYTTPNSSQHTNKRPVFYQNPQAAKERFDLLASGTLCSIVVVRIASTRSYVEPTANKDWEAEYVPEYIVSLS